MKIRYDDSSFLENDSPSGVGRYSRLLRRAIAEQNSVELTTGPFFTTHDEKKPSRPLTLANRFYRKIASYGFGVPYDLLLTPVELTLFPNFYHWPTSRSKITATVIHDLTYLHYPELVEQKNLKHLSRIVPISIKRSDYIITVSEAVKQELIETFHANAENIVVTPIPPDPIYLDSPSHDFRDRYKIPDGKYILFIGNLEPRKNLKTLIEAYMLLPEDFRSEYSLVLAGGKGWYSEQTESAIQKARESGGIVTRIGYVDQNDAPSLHREASLFVCPSKYEGFGMPIIEAYASNTPVVAADIPVLRETAAGGALLADPDSPKEFAEAIEKLLSDTSLQETLHSQAKAQLARISWEYNAKVVIEKAEQILNKEAHS